VVSVVPQQTHFTRQGLYALIMSGTPARLSLTVTSYIVIAPSMRGTGASFAVLGHSMTLPGFMRMSSISISTNRTTYGVLSMVHFL
jgi:hypothetical protein